MEALLALLRAHARSYASASGAAEPSGLLNLAGQQRDALVRELAEPEALAAVLATELVQAVERRQQFAARDPALERGAEQIFATSLKRFAAALSGPAADVERAARAAFDEEAHAMGVLLAARSGAVVCAEYSLELQLGLLGVSVPDLLEPILDLGCGEKADLVAHCRAQGKVALGLDRHAQGPNTVRADWLEYVFPREAFGTILSHQAFSLHFLHHHLGSEAQARAYAAKYMELLGSLKPGGAFVYAPGLPFIEQHLPAAKWRLTRTPLPPPLRESVDSVFRARVGADVAYACRVVSAART